MGREDYRSPVQLLMPYNYTLRHAVKCYTNNNVNREQLQSQCKLWGPLVCFRFKKSNTKNRQKNIRNESQFIDTEEKKNKNFI